MNRNIGRVASQKKMLRHHGEATDKVGDRAMADLFAKHLEKTTAWLQAQYYSRSSLSITTA